jgi:hypothetical protein
VTTSIQTNLARQRSVQTCCLAARIVGDRNPDWKDIEDRFDRVATLLQINAEFSDELERLEGHG